MQLTPQGFNTKGATPFQTTTPSTTSSGVGSFLKNLTSTPTGNGTPNPQTQQLLGVSPPPTPMTVPTLSSHAGVGPTMISPLLSQGGTHSVTDAAGNTSIIKINPQKTPTTQVAGSTTQTPPATPATSPTTYDYNTGKPLAPGQAQSQFNTQTGQQIGAAPSSPSAPTMPAIPPTDNTQSNPNGIYGQAINNVSNTANQGANNITNAAFGGPYNQGLLNSVNNVNGAASGNLNIGQNAANIAAAYGKEMGDVNKGFQNLATGDLSTGTSPVAGGNAGLAYQNESGRLQGLATAEQAALQGTGQQLTAQQQAQTGYGQAGQLSGTGLNSQIGGATNAANNALSGATSAAGFLAPSQTNVQVPYNNQYLNASTGSPVNPNSSLSMNDAVSLQVAKLKAGTTSPADAQAALAAYGQAGTNALQNQLGPGWNSNTATGASAAQQSNTQTAGTATTNANQAVYNQAVNDSANTQAAVQNVDSFGKILMDPTQNGGINPFDPKIANRTWADVQNQFSGAAQAKFNSTLTALQQKIGDLLQAGGSGTAGQLSTDAKSILDGTANLGTIGQVLDRIGTEGNALQKTLEGKKNDAYKAMQGGSGSGTSNSTSGFGWNG